ncbi:MAG: helix-turn-helix domain-containing protein [Peptococcaceae bacterium]|nr:helix-turn-helix domain-containing protein [Peptococcaceae bacterium]
MNLGQNLQFLRKMSGLTQESLAEKLNVSRQTISKWELDTAYPELDKIIDLCKLFNCTMDQLIREEMNVSDDMYSNIRCEWVEPFRYLQHIVISSDPESDALEHMKRTAEKLGIAKPKIIGWDFPKLSQEQINVYNMHGYAAALILPDEIAAPEDSTVLQSPRQEYAAITIREPFAAPFTLIPNAYKMLLTYMKTNGLNGKRSKEAIECFEWEYTADGIDYMDVFIALG